MRTFAGLSLGAAESCELGALARRFVGFVEKAHVGVDRVLQRVDGHSRRDDRERAFGVTLRVVKGRDIIISTKGERGTRVQLANVEIS